MHFLGQVGAGVVNNNGLRFVDRQNQSVSVVKTLAGTLGQGVGAQEQVDEAWAGDLGPGQQIAAVDLCDHLDGELARIGAQLTGHRHDAVGLIIAEFGPGGINNLRFGITLAGHFDQCFGDDGFQRFSDGKHDYFLSCTGDPGRSGEVGRRYR